MYGTIGAIAITGFIASLELSFDTIIDGYCHLATSIHTQVLKVVVGGYSDNLLWSDIKSNEKSLI
jgi:hypothetical protein